MPTYEYRCKACDHEWEREQRITEDAIKKCPSCKKMKAQRLVGGGNFILKGSGWYADLYHKPAPKKAGSGEGKADDSSKASAASEAKSDKSGTGADKKTESKKSESKEKPKEKPKG